MRILIADDDDSFRALITEVVSEAGYTPLPELNGRLAWERLKREGADMAVLDVNMPEMDGIELLKRIRQDEIFKDLPVIMLTIRAFTEDHLAGYGGGADDYLTKPFDNAILTARLQVLARRILGRAS